MQKSGFLAAAVLLLAGVLDAGATTWVTSTVKDPITGRSVRVQEPASSGSYIYRWPGKEDLVFWPHTDDAWLWFNPSNGYGAFGDDFVELPAAAKEPVRDWLKKNYQRQSAPQTRLEMLRWFERIYALRAMDDDFWCHFYRLMAFELRDNAEESLAYVRKTMPLLQARLSGSEESDRRLETLYLLGEYNRRLGNYDLMRQYFAQVRTARYKTEDGEEHVGHPYFVELVTEREALAPAGERSDEAAPK